MLLLQAIFFCNELYSIFARSLTVGQATFPLKAPGP